MSSTTALSGPVPLSRVWSRDKLIAEDLTGEDLSDVLQHNADATAWWVLPRDLDYGAAELRDVAQALDLDDLAISDLLATDRRAKFEALGTARLVVTNLVTHDRSTRTLTAHPISIIATDRVLICLVADVAGFHPARLLLQKSALLAEGGVEVGLQVLVAAVVDTYESAAEWLEDAAGDLSQVLLEERPLSRGEQLDAFRLRAALGQLRRLTEPMRTVMEDLLDSRPPAAAAKGGGNKAIPGARVVRRWNMIAEQHARVAAAADAQRELLSSVLDTSLALADVAMQVLVRKVAAWAAVVAAPLLVASFAGMNVAFPLDQTAAGFWVVMAAVVASVIVLYAAFRRRGWV